MFGWWLYLQKPSIGPKHSMTTVWENRRSTISTVGEIKKKLMRYKAWGQTGEEVMQYFFTSFQSSTTAVFSSYSNELNIYDSWLLILSMPTKSYSYCLHKCPNLHFEKVSKKTSETGASKQGEEAVCSTWSSPYCPSSSPHAAVSKKKQKDQQISGQVCWRRLKGKNLLVHHVLKNIRINTKDAKVILRES